MKINPTYHEKGNLFKKLSRLTKNRGFDVKFILYRLKWWGLPNIRYIGKFPIHLDMELTNSCNLKCPMCPQGMDLSKSIGLSKKGMMDFAVFKKIIDEGEKYGLSSIKLNWRGESTLHPQISEMVKYAKEHGVIDIIMNTNATKLNRKMAMSLISAGIDRIAISFEGTDKITYENIRKGANFEEVSENIRNLISIRKELKKRTPFISINMVDMEETHSQISQFEQIWGEYVDIVIITDYANQQGKDEKDRSVVKSEKKGNFICCQLWQRLFVAFDGTIGLCCQDQDLKIGLGNANDQNISNIWTGKRMDELRKLHLTRKIDEIKLCCECGLRNQF